MEHKPSILAHPYEHKVFSLINHRLTIQEAHSAKQYLKYVELGLSLQIAEWTRKF